MDIFLSVASFAAILAIIIILRSRGSSIDIKTPDIIVAILPAFLFLVVSGKLSKFELSESGLKIETAITEAANTKIEGLEKGLDSEKLPTMQVNSNTKGGVQEIPKLLNNKTEALTFYLGYQGYYNRAIYQYIKQLTGKPFLKYLIILEKDGRFYAMGSAQKFIEKYPDCCDAYLQFEQALKNDDRAALSTLMPDLITLDQALNNKTSRSQALSIMLTKKTDILPVVDEAGKLIGMVDKASISGSLLLEIASSLEKKEK